jgi:hypothetical protein
MEALRQAVLAGYANLEELRIDPNLNALRPRRDFQALLRRVEETVKAAAAREPR